MKIFRFLLLISVAFLFVSGGVPVNEIKWMSMEEAMIATKTKPKKIFIDVYTEWCGWCKKMDQTTFTVEAIREELNKNFYCVKFDAEQKTPITFNNHKFVNPSPAVERSKHEFAAALLQGQMSFPSYVFMDEKGAGIFIIKGYQTSDVLIKYLHYVSSNSHKTMSPEQYLEKNK